MTANQNDNEDPRSQEERRLAALRRYNILDTPPEKEFDRLAQLAAQICGVHTAVVCLVDEHRQWFKAVIGLDVKETGRALSFCAVGMHSKGVFVVPDTKKDARFAAHPMVEGEPHIRFYACCPLLTPDGHAIGTLAVVDRAPRILADSQSAALSTLADLVVQQLEFRRQHLAVAELSAEREHMLATLEDHAEILKIAGRVARVGGWIADLAQGTVTWSPEVAAIHGIDAVSISFEQALASYAPEHRENFIARFRACAKDGVAFDEELQLIQAAGKRVWVRTIGQAVRDSDGVIRRIQGALQDVSDRREAETSLSISRRRFQELADAMPQIVWTATPEGVVDYANKAMVDYVGLTRKDSSEIEWLSALHPDDVAPTLDAWKRAVAQGTSLTIEYRLRRKLDDAYRWMLVQAQPVRGDDGAVVTWYGSVTDNNDRKLAIEALRASEDRFQHVARATTDAIWDWDIATGNVWRNEGFERLYGATREGEIGGHSSWINLLHPEDRDRVLSGIQAAIHASVSVWEDEFRMQRRDGSYAYVLDKARIIRNGSGAAIRMVGGIVDLTGKHEAERAAQEEERARLQIIATQKEIASADLDLQALMTLTAERARELVGATGGEVELLSGSELRCAAASGATTRQVGQRFSRAGSLSDIALQTGETLCCDDSEEDPRVNREICREVGVRSLLVAPLRVGETAIGVVKVSARPPFAFGMREIAHLRILVETLGVVIERRRMSEQMAVSEEQYRMLFQSNPLPMWVHDARTFQFLAVNHAAIEEYGYSRDDFLSLGIRDLWPAGWEGEYEQALGSMPVHEKTFGIKRKHLRKNGEIIDVEIAGGAMEFDGKAARLVLINNVTQRLKAETELARVSRAQKMLSACNETLIRAEQEQTLLDRICQIAVEIGGYRMAWVGFAHNDLRRTIEPRAYAGGDREYLDQLGVSWSPDTVAGRGAVGRATSSGKVVVVSDVATDDSVAPWRSRALAYGFRAIVALPLRVRDRVFGVFVLYANEVMDIAPEELSLLEELANDLAFGIGNLRSQAEQRRVHRALMKVATAVSSYTNERFFELMIQNMVDALGADAGFVGQVADADGHGTAIAGVFGGALMAKRTYQIGHGLQEMFEWNSTCAVNDATPREWFPDLEELPRDGMRSLVGHRLVRSNGSLLGHLFAMFREPPEDADFVVSTLQIFASRASGELQRRETDERLHDQASLLDRAQDAIIVRDLQHKILFWNKSAERLYGWTAQEALNRSIADLLYDDKLPFLLATERAVQLDEWTGEIEQRRKDGSIAIVEGRWTLVRDEAGSPKSILAINTDIGARKKAEQAIHRLAFFDALTGLPNRLLLMDRMERALAMSARTKKHGALLFIDLDNFKTLNDTLGHDKGDELLVQIARQLSGAVREADTVARFGGDEFVVMLEGLSEERDVARSQMVSLGQKILGLLNQTYTLDGYEHRCTSSIGVAPFSDHEATAGELLKHADLAMYQAKAAGRNALRVFDPGMQDAVSARAILEADLRDAVARKDFLLYFQPQADMAGRLTGVEALARWPHQSKGMVSPGVFIPMAEETGLIFQLGEWVLETACGLLVSWMSTPQLHHLSMSVNVSARQFHHPDFVQQVLGVLDRTGADAHRLKLELTESLLADDMESIVGKMTTLRRRGVEFSLDDFGTGYSSLAYLKRLPLSQLKIDQSFVRDVLTDTNDAAIARTIITLGASLGLNVVAEGVELTEQREFLSQNGCHGFQGYLLSAPLPQDRLRAFIREAMVETTAP